MEIEIAYIMLFKVNSEIFRNITTRVSNTIEFQVWSNLRATEERVSLEHYVKGLICQTVKEVSI